MSLDSGSSGSSCKPSRKIEQLVSPPVLGFWVLLEVRVQSSNSLRLHCPGFDQLPEARVHAEPLLCFDLAGPLCLSKSTVSESDSYSSAML